MRRALDDFLMGPREDVLTGEPVRRLALACLSFQIRLLMDLIVDPVAALVQSNPPPGKICGMVPVRFIPFVPL